MHHYQTGWDQNFGLPFTTASRTGAVPNPDGSTKSRYLSTEIFDCTPGGSCSSTADRATYVRYEMDAIENCGVDSPCYRDRNRRAWTERTLYVSDGGKYADVDSSAFDGLGHYRTRTTGGNFTTGNVRTNTTYYNYNTRGWSPGTWSGSSVGTYSVDASGNRLSGFTMLGASDSWVLGTYTEDRVTEAGTTLYTQACFDPQKNLLARKRQLKGTTAGANDLLSVQTTDTNGNLIREESYGGDGQAIGTTALCTMTLPSSNVYRIDHAWQNGALASSELKTAAGASVGFKSLDQTIDASTGLVSQSRDSAGVWTNYEYDTMGRLTWVKPQSDAWTWYDYRNATSTPQGTAQVQLFQYANGGGATLARSTYEYEHFGRLKSEWEWLPDNQWSFREIEYDHAGRQSRVSPVLQYTGPAPTNWTTTAYDLYGRPLTVTTPDGKTTTFSYTGARLVTRTANAGTAWNGSNVTESAVSVTEEYDRQGRLQKVTEPAGAMTYTYHVSGNLSQVCGATCTEQKRIFTWDRRGWLASETHPEKGVTGNGTVTYTYDARGNVLTRKEGTSTSTSRFNLSFSYDRAGRVLSVAEPNAPVANRVVKEFTYGTAGNAKGKLETATRHNHDRLNQATAVKVTETYVYGGLGGRISSRTTNVTAGATTIANFTKGVTWDALGQPVTTAYPDCTAPASCGGSDAARTVTSTYGGSYSRSFLTAVGDGTTNYASGITYHANRMWKTIPYGNGLVATQTVPSNNMARPANISLSNGWQTGTYAYDGVGNITRIGSNYYIYDGTGRLTEGTAEWTSSSVHKLQQAEYDPHGNLTRLTNRVNGAVASEVFMEISKSTNRICGPGVCTTSNVTAVYDDAGNQTSTGWENFTFDTQNLMATLDGDHDQNYYYTADDERIWVQNLTANTSRWTLRDFGRNVLREYTTTGGTTAQTWTWARDYVYRGGSVLASVTAPSTVTYFHQDHLGSTRLTTSSTGATIATTNYYPFGAEATTATAETKKYTGHERDYNPNGPTDYMHARYYKAAWGRFLSVDPGRDWTLSSTQSWNLYGYVRSNSVNAFDPDGSEMKFADYASAVWRATAMTADELAYGVAYPMLLMHSGLANDDPKQIAGAYALMMSEAAVGVGLKIGAPALARIVGGPRMPAAESPALKAIIGQLYKGSDSISGGTAGAIRREILTGKPVGSRGFHFQKGYERLRQLDKLIGSGKLSAQDAQVASQLADDLRKALHPLDDVQKYIDVTAGRK